MGDALLLSVSLFETPYLWVPQVGEVSPHPPLSVLGLDGGPKEEAKARAPAPVTLPPLLDCHTSPRRSFDGTSVILFDGPASAPHSPCGGRLRPSLRRQFGPEAASVAPSPYDPTSGWAVVMGYHGGQAGGGCPPTAAAAATTSATSVSNGTTRFLRCNSGGFGGDSVPCIGQGYSPLGTPSGGGPLLMTSRPATSAVLLARDAAASRPNASDPAQLSIGLNPEQLMLRRCRTGGSGGNSGSGSGGGGRSVDTSTDGGASCSCTSRAMMKPGPLSPGSPLKQHPSSGCAGSRGGLGEGLDFGQLDAAASGGSAPTGFAPGGGIRRSFNDSFEKRYHLGTRRVTLNTTSILNICSFLTQLPLQ